MPLPTPYPADRPLPPRNRPGPRQLLHPPKKRSIPLPSTSDTPTPPKNTSSSITTPSKISPSRQLYFKKTEAEDMTPLTYNCLRQVIADNPESLHQLQLAATIKHIGIGLLLASVLTESIGMYKTFNIPKFRYQQPPPGQEYHPQPQPHHPASPLMYIGGGGFIAASILIFNAHHQVKKALKLYNQ